MKPRAKAPLMLINQEHYNRLVDHAIQLAQPPMHLSCDWIDDPMGLGLMFFPLHTYERLRELNANSSSRDLESQARPEGAVAS